MLQGKGIITELQKRILLSFSGLPDSTAFYLTGGTALAEFYFAHRKSYDLDLFTCEKDIILPFGRVLEDEFRKSLSVSTVRRFETFIEFDIADQRERTRVHLAYDSPFRFEKPMESTVGVRVNGYQDLITDKLLAFFGRAEPRDAIDLHFVLATDDFWRLVEFASRKDPGFDLYWLAVALQKVMEFPDEVSRWPVEMLKEVDVLGLKHQFLDLSKQLMERIKGR